MPSAHLLFPLLFPVMLAGPTRAADTRPTKDDGHVTFEIIETGKGTKHRTRFELPANGKVETWTETGENGRFCTVESSLDRSRGDRSVHLRCKDHPASSAVQLEVHARPPVEVRGRMVLADIERPDGRRIQVAMKTS